MKNKSIHITKSISNPSWVRDFSELVKLRLNLLVVFSAIMAAMICTGGNVTILQIGLLAIGGFCITGSANALNEVLERDYDKLMKRTADRPVAAGRMSMENAVMIAGFLCIIGVTALGLFNPMTALLGVLSLISYAFVYTPMKRYSPWAAIIGAVPGALPVVIGCTAMEGQISTIALLLFGIQFLWQLPHFWAIAWLGDADYKNAGFQLLPNSSGEKNKSVGLASVIASVLLIGVGLMPLALNLVTLVASIGVLIIGLMYLFFSLKLYKTCSDEAARKLMFMSFAYLPLVLILFTIGS